MPRPRTSLVLLACLVGGLTLGASPRGGRAEQSAALARNRRLLDQWRADPEHAARLQKDLRDFWALPLERQEQMRKLDRDLHAQPPATQARLWSALERYTAWLERLSPQVREQVLSTESAWARLKLIRELREQEWVDRLPAKLREELMKLPPEKRGGRVAALRQAERWQRQHWGKPRPKVEPPIRPRTLEEMPAEVRAFFEENVKPRLTKPEAADLEKAKGKWPQFAQRVLVLSERHPVLPAQPGKGMRRIKDLPSFPKKLVMAPPGPKWAEVKAAEGRWPDFALALSKAWPKVPFDLGGACRPAHFSPNVQAWLQGVLPRHASEAEKERLGRLEGRWPDYPMEMHHLAREHRLVIPGMTLPGPRELWEAIRPE